MTDCCDHIDPNKPLSGHDHAVGGFYSCPMHPRIQQDKPGMCPECGMTLVKVKKRKIRSESEAHAHAHNDGTGLNKHAGHRTADFLKKFWIALVLTIPIFLYSEMAGAVGIHIPGFSGSAYLFLILGSVIYFYCGWIFLASAYRESKALLPGMMTLIALAITTAYAYSVYETLIAGAHALWFELSTLIAIMLLGHWIEMRSVQGAQGALKELAKLLPDRAERIKPGSSETETILIGELKAGDVLMVRPGSKVPADGKIIEGASGLDESMITGESKPVEKSAGAEVIGGSVNGDGSLRMEVTRIGENTFLSGVMRLVADAQASKSRLQTLSDRAALWLTGMAIGSGAVTVIVWIALGAGMPTAIERLVAVLVIACPHALGLAIPLVSSISTTMGARNGLLVRQRLALEAARNTDVVLFDKTGTLTQARFKVTRSSSDEALALAASVNAHSEHPIAKAIVEEARRRSLHIQEAADFKRVPGKGAEGDVAGARVFVGTKGGDDIAVEREGKAVGNISVADAIRPESKEAIAHLKRLGVRIAMVTGDSEAAAKLVADELGLDEYFARVLPEDKVKKVEELQSRGLKVAMVGDGINDAPALTQADIGIAIGAGTTVAIESAGIVLVRSDPRDIAKIVRLSRLTYSKMIQNLWWAAGYNIVAIPLAAGVLAHYGVFLQPALAAAFMSVSTVIVALNAMLLKRAKL